jgi:hypothetical protein
MLLSLPASDALRLALRESRGIDSMYLVIC